MFYRINKDNNAVLFRDNGLVVTRLNKSVCVWPVGSNLSARYEHPEGIILTVEDAERIGIEAEYPVKETTYRVQVQSEKRTYSTGYVEVKAESQEEANRLADEKIQAGDLQKDSANWLHIETKAFSFNVKDDS